MPRHVAAPLPVLLLAIAMAASGCTQSLSGPGGPTAPGLPGSGSEGGGAEDGGDQGGGEDGTLDPNADSDGNGIPDPQEGAGDTDGDGVIDALDDDDDGDGLSDSDEIDGNPGSPPDTDNDGIPDYLDTDSDNDGLPDALESNGDADGDGVPNYLDLDSDGDGMSDSEEGQLGPGDADGDGFLDFLDPDSDNDSTPDGDEVAQGTNPFDRDTDGDGFGDLAELTIGSDPTDPNSGIDGFYAELAARDQSTITVPFTPEILQADVLFLLDSTCSMTGVLNTMANNFSQVVAGMSIPDVSMGVAEFNDYVYQNWITVMGLASAGDKPFRLTQQVTADYNAVQAALGSLSVRDGADQPESSMEALFQTATGSGFDQNCNGGYDAQTDVPSFLTGGTAQFPGAFSSGIGGIYTPGLPGTGPIGGAGFRAGSVPIIVYTTDNVMRDPDAGFGVPSGCSNPAGASDVTAAVTSIGGKLIGIGTSPLPIAQMTSLAQATDSMADINGDGFEQPLVFEGTSNATVGFVNDGIEAIAAGSLWDLTLEVDDAPHDFVLSTVPAVHTNVQINTEVTFDVTLYPGVPQGSGEQVFVFPMQVLGDGVSVLAEWELVLVVLPGS